MLTAYCLLPSAFFGAHAQKDAEESPAQAAVFHRWGAVTLFHGLPSDRVRAIAQDAEGLLWFGTDAGLAHYDGRRTHTVTEGGLAAARVLALRGPRRARCGWAPTTCAYLRTPAGEFKAIPETNGPARRGRHHARPRPRRRRHSDGLVFDCRARADGTYGPSRSRTHLPRAEQQPGHPLPRPRPPSARLSN